MTPEQVAERLERIRARIPQELELAQEEVGKQAVTIAQKWSSGTETAAQLRAAGHPYSTRHAHAAQSGLINRQTTAEGSASFFVGWHYDAGQKALINSTPYGHFLQEGTVNMVARDILGAIRRELKPILREAGRRAMRRSLKA